jgi:thymidylate synthase (FAD)
MVNFKGGVFKLFDKEEADDSKPISGSFSRDVLPNSLKTEIVITYNLREWRHFFRLRCDKRAHPQMREIAIPLLKEFQRLIPVIFDDIIPE